MNSLTLWLEIAAGACFLYVFTGHYVAALRRSQAVRATRSGDGRR